MDGVAYKIAGVGSKPDSTGVRYSFSGQGYRACEVGEYKKGSQQYENVQNGNKNAYPEDGYQGEYWYVYIEK